MDTFSKKICIVGAGGFGREVLCLIMDILENKDEDISKYACFMVDDEYYKEATIMGVDVIPRSKFDALNYNIVIAVGDPIARKKIVDSLPEEATYATLIHPRACLTKFVEIGEGSIITAGSVLTCNIKLGKHTHINLNSTIGHDCDLGNYFTTAPDVNISGNCTFGECVYFGTNASVREKITICNNVVIGMGSVVVKHIAEEGVYIGSPAKKLEKK